jgi:nitroimidazol reductase NimA-like FMN-containing flavoprotein (pyridoxamine 5'-phosphate oxidase superfamily)
MSGGARAPVRMPSEILDRQACIERLASVPNGRVAWATPSGAVVVLPVNFILDGQTIVFSTGPGDKLTAIRAGRPLSFEADDVERAVQTGWSVLVTGIAEIVEDPQQIHRIEQLHTWALISDQFVVRLPLTEITGRLLPLHHGGITVTQLSG